MTINQIEEKGLLIYKVIRGSHAYGTSLPTSDTDYSGIYIQPFDDILGLGYQDQASDAKNDIVYYEVRRFLELLASNNPTVLELLNTPEDCVAYKHPVMDVILEQRDVFITKICRNSFGGYARQQIQKAQGLNKKMNWEKSKVTRKGPLDFCYVILGEKTFPLIEYLEKNNINQKFCGVAKVPHARDIYALFFDSVSQQIYTEGKTEEERKAIKSTYGSDRMYDLGFKGIAMDTSNKIRLSSIPKHMASECVFYYNEDGYSMHCREYKEYQEWLENRNTQRYVDIANHEQAIDGKNMMHTRRLLDMAKEIAQGKGINVRRPDAEFLISIRQGKIDLQTLLDHADAEIDEIDRLFLESDLPDKVDMHFVDRLLVRLRKQFYLHSNVVGQKENSQTA